MTLHVLDPTFDGGQATQATVSRLSSLAGRTVGLLDNGKLNVDILLNHVETLLRSQHGVSTVIRLQKPEPETIGRLRCQRGAQVGSSQRSRRVCYQHLTVRERSGITVHARVRGRAGTWRIH